MNNIKSYKRALSTVRMLQLVSCVALILTNASDIKAYTITYSTDFIVDSIDPPLDYARYGSRINIEGRLIAPYLDVALASNKLVDITFDTHVISLVGHARTNTDHKYSIDGAGFDIALFITDPLRNTFSDSISEHDRSGPLASVGKTKRYSPSLVSSETISANDWDELLRGAAEWNVSFQFRFHRGNGIQGLTPDIFIAASNFAATITYRFSSEVDMAQTHSGNTIHGFYVPEPSGLIPLGILFSTFPSKRKVFRE